MFANRFTAFVDACSLAGAMKRNLLLTLAEAEFYRLRWSQQVLDETEKAIGKILERKGAADPESHATKARSVMEAAFEEADVGDFSRFLPVAKGLPDPNDEHVLAAALKSRAHVIVTDNVKHFPPAHLEPLGLSSVTTDEFLANTIALSEGAAVSVIRRMRADLKKPEMTADALLLAMEASDLVITADLLKEFVGSI